jgi:DNA-binding transcriptional ArsR family regulator
LRHFDAVTGALAMVQEAFDALADPTRRQILQFLADHDEATAGQIAGQIGTVGRTAVSSHLRVLRTAAMVTERRDGRFRYYSLDARGPVQDVLSFLENLLGSSPESLAGAVEAGFERESGARLAR